MKIRFHHTLALLCCAGVTAAMAGCAPEETGAITEDGDEGAAVATDGAAQPALQPEVNAYGECCNWRCSNQHPHNSSIPTVNGTCQDYARFWCKEHGQGVFIEGSAYWGGC